MITLLFEIGRLLFYLLPLLAFVFALVPGKANAQAQTPIYDTLSYSMATGKVLYLQRGTANLFKKSGSSFIQVGVSNPVIKYPYLGLSGVPSVLSDTSSLKDSIGKKLNKADFVSSFNTALTYAAIVAALNFTPIATTNVSAAGKSGNYSDLLGKPTIPTNTNQLTNGSGFITSSALSGYALTSSVPTNTNQLTNGSGFITSSALASYALTSSVPTNTNQLTNGSGFITSSALSPYALSSSVVSLTKHTADSATIRAAILPIITS